MKIFIWLLIFIITAGLFAVELDFGATGGANFTYSKPGEFEIDGDPIGGNHTSNLMLGYTIGLYTNVSKNNNFFQIDINYSYEKSELKQTFDNSDYFSTSNYEIEYLDILLSFGRDVKYLHVYTGADEGPPFFRPLSMC